MINNIANDSTNFNAFGAYRRKYRKLYRRAASSGGLLGGTTHKHLMNNVLSRHVSKIFQEEIKLSDSFNQVNGPVHFSATTDLIYDNSRNDEISTKIEAECVARNVGPEGRSQCVSCFKTNFR